MATFTDDDIERLHELVTHGEQSVTFGDQSTTFIPAKERLELLDRARTDQARAAGRPRITYRQMNGGF